MRLTFEVLKKRVNLSPGNTMALFLIKYIAVFSKFAGANF